MTTLRQAADIVAVLETVGETSEIDVKDVRHESGCTVARVEMSGVATDPADVFHEMDRCECVFDNGDEFIDTHVIRISTTTEDDVFVVFVGDHHARENNDEDHDASISGTVMLAPPHARGSAEGLADDAFDEAMGKALSRALKHVTTLIGVGGQGVARALRIGKDARAVMRAIAAAA